MHNSALHIAGIAVVIVGMVKWCLLLRVLRGVYTIFYWTQVLGSRQLGTKTHQIQSQGSYFSKMSWGHAPRKNGVHAISFENICLLSQTGLSPLSPPPPSPPLSLPPSPPLSSPPPPSPSKQNILYETLFMVLQFTISLCTMVDSSKNIFRQLGGGGGGGGEECSPIPTMT